MSFSFDGNDRPIWRQIAEQSEHLRPGHEKSRYVGGSNCFVLVGCGHYVRRKISQGTPNRIRCHECEHRRNGSVQTTYDLEAKTKQIEAWDSENALPKRTTERMSAGDLKRWAR